jgi:hypothetical protein
MRAYGFELPVGLSMALWIGVEGLARMSKSLATHYVF